MSDTKNKRRHTRIPFETRIDLRFEDQEFLTCETRDLCLSGVWVESDASRNPGDSCEIVFHQAGIMQNRPLCLRGEVARVTEEGMAVLFTDMNYRTYTGLQAVLLDHADNPFDVAEEFLDQLPIDQ